MNTLANKNNRICRSKSLARILLLCAPALSLLLSGGSAMAYPTFICVYEKDHNPSLDAEAELWFQEARVLEKVRGIKNWRKIVWLYEKAIAKDHWKAMHNLAGLYRTGWPGNRVLNKTLAKCSTSTNAW